MRQRLAPFEVAVLVEGSAWWGGGQGKLASFEAIRTSIGGKAASIEGGYFT